MLRSRMSSLALKGKTSGAPTNAMACMRDGFQNGVLLNDRYQVVRSLNHGAFGMVVLAKDTTSGDLVAIKSILKPGSCQQSSAVAVDEMSQELACHGRLGSHPNIVRLLDDFDHGPHNFLVLEYCSKGDLFDITRRRLDTYDFIPTCYARELIFKLIDAVEYIHSKGVYHRDIKLENVFVTELGEIKLGDFGLATVDTLSQEPAVGSQAYMAPEQYCPTGAGYSPEKADIWAVGICILVILFGYTPFESPASQEDKCFANFELDKHSLLDVYPRLTLDGFEVLSHALALDPDKRSLTGMRQALDRVFTFTIYEELYEELRQGESQAEDLLRDPSVPLSRDAEARASLVESSQEPRPQMPTTGSHGAGALFNERAPSYGTSSLADLGASLPEVPALVADSSLGASLISLITPGSHLQAPSTQPPSSRGARPVPSSTIQRIPSLSVVFGTSGHAGARSWTDLWDEETEALSVSKIQGQRLGESSVSEDEYTQSEEKQCQAPRMPVTPKAVKTSPEVKSPSDHFKGSAPSLDDIDECDGFYLIDHPHRQSPPKERNFAMCRQDILDRWAALGERRRAGKGASSATPKTSRQIGNWRSGRDLGNAGAETSVSPWKVNVRDVGNWRTGAGFGRPGKDYAVRKMDLSEKVHHHDSGEDIVDLDWVCG